MAIEATVITDSLAPCGSRCTTFKLVYPWFIHWDLLTHRALSRNAMSSRAMPIWKVIRQVLKTPAMPHYWGRNGRGMQAKGALPNSLAWVCKLLWLSAMLFNVGVVWLLSKIGLHKQDANKLLTPFLHITTVATATEWANFFNLRSHPDAHPTFQALADAMLEAYVASVPKQLKAGEWHLPFADKLVPEGAAMSSLLKIATARLARVSYLTHDGELKAEKDYTLHDDLLRDGHMSPFEHSCRAESERIVSGNFIGYTQYRKLIPGENRTAFDARRLLEQRKRHASHHLA